MLMTATLTGNPTLVKPNFDTPPANPLIMLKEWLEEAERLGIVEPKGLILSTVNDHHHPSSRVVFLRACDEKGIIFATSENSFKGKELASNPWAAGTLWWRETLQQINFQGHVVQLSKEKSNEIFQARTREAQCVAVVSHQSAALAQEEVLQNEFQHLMSTKEKINRPEDYFAYHLVIETIEFWHGGLDRLHKRLRYERVNDAWLSQKLQP
jgi:pyridoxamine 5'-phosphate oxidase